MVAATHRQCVHPMDRGYWGSDGQDCRSLAGCQDSHQTNQDSKRPWAPIGNRGINTKNHGWVMMCSGWWQNSDFPSIWLPGPYHCTSEIGTVVPWLTLAPTLSYPPYLGWTRFKKWAEPTQTEEIISDFLWKELVTGLTLWTVQRVSVYG